MSDVLIHVTASLNKTKEGVLKVSNIALDVHADDITLHFENLIGKSSWSDITNTVLNTLSNLMFDEVKHIVLNEMEDEIRKRVDEQLATLPKNMPYENSSTLFDAFLERSKAAIADKFEPFHLSDQSKQFLTRILRFNVSAELKLYNGTVNGLTTLTRTGDIIAEYDNDSVTIVAELGFENLTSSYQWIAKLMGAGPSGSASVSVNSIAAQIKLRQLLTKNSKPTLEEFRISNIKHVWVDIKGLGSGDFLLEIFINLISNTFKRSLALAISGPIRDSIQNELDVFPVSFI
ncbi:uncharacterized protein B4U80_06917 [Leptotrombidium deliense]|uniref:Uncharacterized protein n=1 Tax=Leptotrombidium deliense TaxID=299467 RepID=A0A443S9Y0_9ACAR|nr:uncharacterized protein B4U80_06917 [Leptotrombidium deliense]